MCDILVGVGGQNYVLFFSVFMANIKNSYSRTIERLKRGDICVAKTFIPINWCEVNKTIEEMIMKSAKSKR